MSLAEKDLVSTPDPWVVPHIGPLLWPAVFATDDRRLWVWGAGKWGWLERADFGFVALARPPSVGAALPGIAADRASPGR